VPTAVTGWSGWSGWSGQNIGHAAHRVQTPQLALSATKGRCGVSTANPPMVRLVVAGQVLHMRGGVELTLRRFVGLIVSGRSARSSCA
jgi:hypothetical protein